MGDLIPFTPKKVRMCPDDWVEQGNPTLRELQLTIETIKECYYDCLKQLDTVGIHSEIELRYKIRQMECMYIVLMEYYTPE